MPALTVSVSKGCLVLAPRLLGHGFPDLGLPLAAVEHGWPATCQVMCRKENPEAHLCKASATTQTCTFYCLQGLLLQPRSALVFQFCLSPPISCKHRPAPPTQLIHTFIPSWSQAEGPGHCPGSLSNSPMTEGKLRRRY